MSSHKDAGIAMLLTLFALAVISTLALVIIGKGHNALEQNRMIIKRAQSLAITEGAIKAVYPLLLDENRDHILQVNGNRIRHNIGGTNISVGIYDACGKWDLNSGHIDILKALLMKLLPASSKRTIFYYLNFMKVTLLNQGGLHGTKQLKYWYITKASR